MTLCPLPHKSVLFWSKLFGPKIFGGYSTTHLPFGTSHNSTTCFLAANTRLVLVRRGPVVGGKPGGAAKAGRRTPFRSRRAEGRPREDQRNGENSVTGHHPVGRANGLATGQLRTSLGRHMKSRLAVRASASISRDRHRRSLHRLVPGE